MGPLQSTNQRAGPSLSDGGISNASGGIRLLWWCLFPLTCCCRRLVDLRPACCCSVAKGYDTSLRTCLLTFDAFISLARRRARLLQWGGGNGGGSLRRQDRILSREGDNDNG